MVGMAFFRQQQDPTRPVGVIAVSIGNFFALENLHGKAAVNHALFVCASRLRRCVPADVEMGRLARRRFPAGHAQRQRHAAAGATGPRGGRAAVAAGGAEHQRGGRATWRRARRSGRRRWGWG